MIDREFMCLRCDKERECATGKMCFNYFRSVSGVSLGNRKRDLEDNSIPQESIFERARQMGVV